MLTLSAGYCTDVQPLAAQAVKQVTVTLAAPTLTVGGRTTATASARLANGTYATNKTVIWASSNYKVAVVSTKGVVSTIGAGTATITGAISGFSGSATLTVTPTTPSPTPLPPTVATVTVALGQAALTAGQTTQATAMPKDSSGDALANRAVAWSSSAPSIATVATDGLVTTLAAGSASIRATVDGKTGSATLTVRAVVVDTTTPPTPTPVTPSATSIPVSIVRFDGLDTGTVLVSNAIPLQPGALRDTGLANLKILIGGVEQSIYTEALEAKHPDGSLRSVLVQFRTAARSSSPIAAEFRIGEHRTVAALAKPTTGRSIPIAAALPTSADYLVATDVVGPTVTAAKTAPISAAFAQYDSDFAKWADYQWTATKDDWAAGDYYDRALIYYAMWARTANPTYWYRGTLMAVNYRKGYVEPNNGRLSAYWSQMEGLEKHYVLTGDDSSRAAIGSVALPFLFWDGVGFRMLDSAQLGQDPQWATNDDRLRARIVMIALLAYRVNASPQGQGPDGRTVYAAKLDTALTRIFSTAPSDGMHRFGLLCNGSLNYMQGQLNDALMKVYWYYAPDARIPDFIKRSTDYLWSKWHSDVQAFEYLSGANDAYASADGTCQDKGNAVPAGDLNNMMVNGFGFTSLVANDPTYRTKGDEVFAGGVKNAYLVGDKQFNEAYTSSFWYLALRAGITSPSGAMATGSGSRVRRP